MKLHVMKVNHQFLRSLMIYDLYTQLVYLIASLFNRGTQLKANEKLCFLFSFFLGDLHVCSFASCNLPNTWDIHNLIYLYVSLSTLQKKIIHNNSPFPLPSCAQP